MSSFHGMCSLGGLIGAMLVTALLAIGLSPLMSTLSVVMVLLVVSFVAIPSALTTFEQDEQGAAEITDAPKIFTSERYDPFDWDDVFYCLFVRRCGNGLGWYLFN